MRSSTHICVLKWVHIDNRRFIDIRKYGGDSLSSRFM